LAKAIKTVLEITVSHWPFSNQYQQSANQNPFWSANFTVHFQWDGNQITYNMSYLRKMANQFLTMTFIPTTVKTSMIDRGTVGIIDLTNLLCLLCKTFWLPSLTLPTLNNQLRSLFYGFYKRNHNI